MKIYRLIAIAIAMLFAQPALAQKAAWGVSNLQNQVFRLDVVFKQVPGSLKQVSVGADGAVWGVDPNDNVLRWTGSQMATDPREPQTALGEECPRGVGSERRG